MYSAMTQNLSHFHTRLSMKSSHMYSKGLQHTDFPFTVALLKHLVNWYLQAKIVNKGSLFEVSAM